MANVGRIKKEEAYVRMPRTIVKRLADAGILRPESGYLVGIVPACIENDIKSGTSQRSHCRIVQVEREASLQRRISDDSPPFKDPAHCRSGPERVGDGEFILIARHEALTGIKVRITPVQAGNQWVHAAVSESRALKA